MSRQFIFNNAALMDPDPSMTPEQVKQMFASAGYPALTNASIVGPTTKDGKQTYEFKAAVGTKG